ncbi:MAG: hypothetical protein ABSF64_07180 [Bryobacteraceae bacterium]|jgi:hypothetical protein
MKNSLDSPIRTAICSVTLGFLIGAGAMFAQDQPAAPPSADQQQGAAANGQWRKADDPPPAQSAQAAPPAQATAPAATPSPVEGTPAPEAAPRATMDPNYSQSGQPAAPYPGQGNRYQPPAANYNRGPIPAKLTIKPGTYITVRLNQGLSSDRNQVGDAFAATLAKPVVADGVVIAERGQTVGGKVTEAKKAGRVEGVSRLAVQLTDLTLSDGQPVPMQTAMFTRNGPTSVGRDVGAVGATTAAGAAIGAAADWGRGAAIGAGAGALVGIVGVLVTRGRPTLLYPEQTLTFRVEAPIAVSTEAAPQAFRWVNANDYERPYDVQNRTRPPNPGYYGYGYPSPYAYPYAYAYGYGYPYYWGPGIGLYGGRGYWGRGWGRWR